MGKAFEGIRVIDFSQVLAGPFAAGQLALLGADVIKIEQPGVGDQIRAMMTEGELAELKLSPSFLGVNAGKRGITLDLKHAKAPEVVHRLLADADVVVENFKAGVMERLGFGYDSVREVKPDIVYCSISGYGQQGPMAGQGAYDGAIQAASGMMSITGTPESGPLRVGYMPVDISTGITAAFAIASALYRRQVTGQGQYLDVAMLDAAMTLLNPVLSRHLITGSKPELLGNESPTHQGTAFTWPTRNGHIQITVITDRLSARLCEVLGRPEWAEDPRFGSPKGRVEHADEIRADIGAVLLTEDTDTWLQRLTEVGIPASPVYGVADVVQQPQMQHRGVLMQMPAPPGIAGEITVPGAGFTASDGAPGADRPGPNLGQHSDEVLAEIGYSGAEIQALRDDGVI
ncbi:MAG: CaiB/BaiF CoA-transferase family protein [Alphaproteobacteria bacterium]|jgi:formyl-CoA transferase|nr:CaiB/BaiF CoA-transferase family protein [Alphaproteobacteria bacterium]MDP6563890.1 CaiB/BaiF CoA-transferase family protein [Alphaproteobacteria bacterium]